MLFYVLEWFFETGRDINFEQMSKEVLADTLRLFYPVARQKLNPNNPDENPKPYARQSLINIQSSINRHLQLPPYNITWDIMNDSDFNAANKVFNGQ